MDTQHTTDVHAAHAMKEAATLLRHSLLPTNGAMVTPRQMVRWAIEVLEEGIARLEADHV